MDPKSGIIFGEDQAQPVTSFQSSPVPDETVIENIKASVNYKFPMMRAQPGASLGAAMFIAGGPTLREHLDEVKRRHEGYTEGDVNVQPLPIITSNNTYDFLIDHGIVPDVCLIFDPKKRVKDYVKKPNKRTQFYLATVVAPEVWEAFSGEGLQVYKVLVAYGIKDDEDIKLQHKLYPEFKGRDFLVGGTMTPLRAMNWACMIGYKRLEYYGFDSCFSVKEPPLVYYRDNPERFTELVTSKRSLVYKDVGDEHKYVIDEPEDGGYFYAYKKERKENVTVCKLAGRSFLTSPAFGYQAMQLSEWVNRLEGQLEVVVHGDSLSSWILGVRKAEFDAMREVLGDARWTKEYGELQRWMFDKYEDTYGVRGSVDLARKCIPLLGLYELLARPIDALDYGCGQGHLKIGVESAMRVVSITNYDPFHPKWGGDVDPGIHDFTFCTDVMEHVEEICVENTIRWIAERSRYGAYFNICLVPANKELPDGRNAHITVKSTQWWISQINKYFNIVEKQIEGVSLHLVCEKPNAQEVLELERKSKQQEAA